MDFLSTRLLRARTNDDGAALMVALIFILVVGLIVTATLTKSGGVLTTDYALRNSTQMQYATDGGIERGLQVLVDDVAKSPQTFCTADSKPADHDFADPTGLSINGHTAHYSCQTIRGSTPGTGGGNFSNYALVTTGGDHSLTSSNAGNDKNPVPVDGAVYLSGSEADSDLKKQIHVSDGNVVVYDKLDHAGCESGISQLSNIKTLTTGNGIVCGEQSAKDALPTVTLPAKTANTLTNPAPIDYPQGVDKKGNPVTPTCRLFLPGWYTKPPVLLPGKNAADTPANYFVSGLYYFKNIDLDNAGKDVGAWQIPNNDVIIGGQPATGDKSVAPDPTGTGCADFIVDNKGNPLSDGNVLSQVNSVLSKLPTPINIANVDTWNHGTLFVFGGNSEMQVQGASISLYTPPATGSNVPTGAAVSLLAARANTWFDAASTTKDTDQGYLPWTAGAGPLLSTGTAGANMTFNGRILAPDAAVSLFASDPAVAVARAGIAAKTIDLAASAGVGDGNFAFNVLDHSPGSQPPPQERTVSVTACVNPANESADCTSGTAPQGTFRETAVATIDNFGRHEVRVFSWRVG